MANYSNYLLSIFLTTFLFFTTVKSDSFSFNFPSFEPGLKSIITDGDASTTGGILQLTKKDYQGKPTQHSSGTAGIFGLIHLSDKKTGKVADFKSEFTFVVDPKETHPHGDGFTFFLASLDFDFPDNSSGGFLGLFDEKSAFNTSKNSVVAVEFDSFSNEWDPEFPSSVPHIGIDVNSIKSVATVAWPSDNQPQGTVGKAVITYQSYSKVLSASVSYPNSPVKSNPVTVSFPVNFGSVLEEWVFVGFSAATGELVETHDILSWSFNSNL